MPEDNVEVVRAMYEAFAERDEAALLAHLDPEMMVYDRAHHPEASVYEGLEGFLRFAQTDWAVRDGKCVELRNYSTMDEALSAL